MATSRGQRIGIWIIAVVMTVGTIGSFLILILSANNSTQDEKRKTQLTSEYQKLYGDYEAAVAAQAKQLSDTYYPILSPFASRVAAFDKASVTALSSEDLLVGDGEEITATSSYSAYYIGWNPDGAIFDQSINEGTLEAPFTVLGNSGVITGWSEGVVGMKVGGVRLLTIPSDKAYGPNGSGTLIPADTPLKFIIMLVPTPEAISAPQPSEELLKFYE